MNWEAETVSPRKINIKLNSIAPHFLVPDVIASAEFYRDKLGFDFNPYWGARLAPKNAAITRLFNEIGVSGIWDNLIADNIWMH